ncbi:MAG: DNA/RNA non-specific endonuclease, partial [Paramuribaculum sp.]|nr:DNA/RNA non-specific endonuclease [Paramuribaculum sp.]
MKKRSSRRLTATILTIAAIIGAWQLPANCRPATADRNPSASSLYGNLLEVRTNPDCKSEFIKQYPGMDVSFNAEWHQPNWVAWELTRQETNGTVRRENKFYCDETVPGCADHYDYSYSGYDRGHMAPAGDMKWSKEAMHGSFSMANICPQAKALNTGAWKTLEEKCRTWASADSSIIII